MVKKCGIFIIILGLLAGCSPKEYESQNKDSKKKEKTEQVAKTTAIQSDKETAEQQDVPILLTINEITVTSNNELEVTVTNDTEKDIILPQINLTCNLYKDNSNVGFQIVWLENLGKGTNTYKSLPISDDFDSIQSVAYMNNLNMISSGLKSNIQDSPDSGEEVIPIQKTEMIKVK